MADFIPRHHHAFGVSANLGKPLTLVNVQLHLESANRAIHASFTATMWTIPEENVNGRAFIAVIIFLLILAYASVGLRLCTRKITRSTVDASDLTCIAALVRHPMKS